MENNKFTPLSLAQIWPYLIHRFENDAQLHVAIGEVSELFNFDRDQIFRYRKSTKHISAYCAYWLTTNYPKLFVISDLLKDVLNFADFERVIDLGTGPGTFLLALSELTSEKTQLVGVDISDEMLRQADLIIKGLNKDQNITLHTSVKQIEKSDKKTLLIFSHSLNEMSEEQGMAYIRELAPDSILLIEPGTKSFFTKALKVRSHLLAMNYEVKYPCMGQFDCPLDPQKDWCHQFLEVRHAQDVESLTQKLQKDRKRLPLTIQFYTKLKNTSPSTQFNQVNRATIVRVHPETKHSFEWSICRVSEGRHETLRVELPKRGLKKKELKALSLKLAGEVINYKTAKKFDNKERIELA